MRHYVRQQTSRFTLKLQAGRTVLLYEMVENWCLRSMCLTGGDPNRRDIVLAHHTGAGIRGDYRCVPITGTQQESEKQANMHGSGSRLRILLAKKKMTERWWLTRSSRRA